MIARVCGWIGAVLMMAAPFLINLPVGKGLAIAGLALLTVQAYENKMLNLIALNLVGIVGYIWSF